MDGETFLRRYYETGIADLVPEMESVGPLLERLHAAAEALVSVGALDEGAAVRILGEFRDLLDPREDEGLFVGPRGPLGTAEENGPYEWGDLSRQRPAPTLHSVIPVVQQGVIDEMTITVISIEIWSDHITLRSVAFADSDDIQPILWTWTVRDDQGGLYGRGGGQSGGSARVHHIESDFHPAPGPDVHSLIVSARRLRPIEPVRAGRMVPASGIPAGELLRFEIPLG